MSSWAIVAHLLIAGIRHVITTWMIVSLLSLGLLKAGIKHVITTDRDGVHVTYTC